MTTVMSVVPGGLLDAMALALGPFIDPRQLRLRPHPDDPAVELVVHAGTTVAHLRLVGDTRC